MCAIEDRMAAWNKQKEEAVKYYERFVEAVIDGTISTVMLESSNTVLLDVLTVEESREIAHKVIEESQMHQKFVTLCEKKGGR